MDNNTQAEFRLAAQVPRPASYTGPKRRCAVFTLQRDEFYHLPLWLKYYGSQFDPEDMYVIDHNSTLPEVREVLSTITNVEPSSSVDDEIYGPAWYVTTIRAKQLELLERYEYVLFTDVDEWYIPKEGSLRDFVATADKDAYRPIGYEVIENRMHQWRLGSKPTFTRVPLLWSNGCHESDPEVPITDDLFMYHLHRLNYEQAWKKRQHWQAHSKKAWGYDNVIDEGQYRHIFNTNGTQESAAEPWHPRLVAAMGEIQAADFANWGKAVSKDELGSHTYEVEYRG